MQNSTSRKNTDRKNTMAAEQSLWEKMKPYLAMISLQFGYAGMHIVILLSFKKGFSHWVFVVYRHAIATLLFAPFAYFMEKKIRPKMTKWIFFKILVLGFLEPVLDQNLYTVAIQYTSATFAAASVNVLPAITFIMAVIFRMEIVNLKRISSLAKVIGTLVTVSGAMVMTLYRGPLVDFLPHPHGGGQNSAGEAAAGHQWVTGTLMMLSSIVGWAAFFILQKNTLKDYPAELSLTSLICLMGTLEGGVVAVAMERSKSAWAIGFDLRLLAAAYSGIICSGVAYYLQSVVNKARGPVFVTAFSPLSMIITAILGAMILAEQIHLGSLIGAVIIVSGLYSVVWGKSKENPSSDSFSKEAQLPVVVDKNTNGSAEKDTNKTIMIKRIHDEDNLLQQEP